VRYRGVRIIFDRSLCAFCGERFDRHMAPHPFEPFSEESEDALRKLQKFLNRGLTATTTTS
jgi:hypothetical protein